MFEFFGSLKLFNANFANFLNSFSEIPESSFKNLKYLNCVILKYEKGLIKLLNLLKFFSLSGCKNNIFSKKFEIINASNITAKPNEANNKVIDKPLAKSLISLAKSIR